MKIRCITNKLKEVPGCYRNPVTARFLANKQFNLDIGKEYLVYGLSLVEGVTWVDVELDPKSEMLNILPLGLFEIVDGRVSQYWEVKLDERGYLIFWPPSFYRPYYHDDLSEGVKEVVEDFRRVKKLMNLEADVAAGEC